LRWVGPARGHEAADVIAMNTVALLVGLLVLSYLGSFWMTRRAAGGVGLSSGVEYAALGLVLGPQALDLVAAKDLTAFEPVVQVAIGWLAFGTGLDFGFAAERRVSLGRLAQASLSAIVTGGAVAMVTWFVIGSLHIDVTKTERVLLAGGVAAACSQTTRHAVGWVAERFGARGRLSDTLNDIAHSDVLFPLLAVALLFALGGTRATLTKISWIDGPLITISLGIGLGAGAALLLRSEMPVEDTWAMLFGPALLVIGIAARLGLSTLTASFFMGLALSMLSRHGPDLRAMVGPTERPVLLPALLLAGARLDFRSTGSWPWIAAFAIAARIGATILVGWAIAAGSRSARAAGPFVGLSLMSSGALSMCIGTAFALRFPGTIGDTVLVVTVLSATVGEFVGPARLRRSLHLAGEIEDTAVRASPVSKEVGA